MSDVSAATFPELHRVFAGYFHEDFPDDYGTPAAALAAFHADADLAERRRFRHEAQRFLDATASLDFSDVQTLIARLGSRWIPESRQALESILRTEP
jgi:hypothetical protein